jgi:hypothetical protein
MEILEGLFVAHVEEMAAFATGHKSAVFDLPSAGIFGGDFPAIEGPTVHEGLEAGLDFSGVKGSDDQE